MRLFLFLWLAPFLYGCGIASMAQHTVDGIDKTNAQLQKTNELTAQMKEILDETQGAIHLQVLTIAFQQLLSPDNTQVLVPPLRMMPYAETFADEATEDELIRSVHILLQEAILAPPEMKNYRMVDLMALSAIAGFSSMDKTKGILETQVEEKGRYEGTAYVFALSRYNFIRDFLFSPLVENTQYLNTGALKEASDNFLALKHIASLPYVGSLVLQIPSLGVDSKLEPTQLTLLGKKAKRNFLSKLGQSDLASPEVQKQLKSFDP